MFLTSTTPCAALTAFDVATPRLTKAVELRSSKLSALRLVTLRVELTVIGGLPDATFRLSAVAPADVLVFCTSSAAPPTGADRELGVVAVLDWPRMKLPPVAE